MTPEELKQYSDTRRYNLILSIGTGRLQGWFVKYGNNDEAPREAVASTWASDSSSGLMQIENAVYDNSIILGDYDCRLLIDTPRQLVFPQESPPEMINTAMERFYAVSEDDVFVQDICGVRMAFTLCDGLRSFLNRTFAGVSPGHRISPLCRWFGKDGSAPGRIRVYADLDTPWLHLIAYSGDRLLHASTHRISTSGDAAYFIFALWKMLGLSMDDGHLFLSGEVGLRRDLMPLLRRHINYVGLTVLPALEGAEGVSTPVLLAFAD